MNVIVFVEDDSTFPFRIIAHDVPVGRPDSVNVIPYSFASRVTFRYKVSKGRRSITGSIIQETCG